MNLEATLSKESACMSSVIKLGKKACGLLSQAYTDAYIPSLNQLRL